MLQASERVVVLLDEFDELVRERDAPNEVLSRFLTTAMLPKLAALSDRRRLVVLLATNHLESFDTAISRPGRFDMIVPVMPPTLDAKLAHEPWRCVAERAQERHIDFALGKFSLLADQLADFTYAEFGNIAQDLCSADTLQRFREVVEAAYSGCTLMQAGEDGRTWKARISDQRAKIRIPLMS
jgi:SpoVK/Ycf46/Vps4 family AAA+-type ATPase